MTQYLSGKRWPKVILVLLGIALLVIGWAWAIGAFFLELTGSSMELSTPLTAYQYYYHYGTDKEILKWLIISASLATAPVIVLVLLILTPKKRSLHGDARFAKRSEIHKAGLFAEKGIIVGKIGARYLVFGGQEHVLLDAPTRSGKGVGIVIPNLLSWPDSTVVLDLKQENWDITAGYRSEHGQKCFLLNPATRDYKTHRWNPLFYIDDNPDFRINDIQKIAQMLYPDVDGTDPMWSSSSRSFFLALVLYTMETEDKEVTIGEVFRLASGGDDKRFHAIIKDREEEGNPLSGECVGAFNDYLNTSTNTRTSIRKTFTSRLELWANPVIDAATSGNDFDLRDLRKKRMSIYVGITPDDLVRMAPLINLFFQQVIDLNTRELPQQNPALKYQCLLLMDEFTAMGKVGILSKGISYIAGYGMRMLPIIQSPAQLGDVYGDKQADNFIQNHALRIIFPPKQIKTAEEISRTLGDQTVKSKSRSRQLTGKTNKSENISDQRRALLLPQEVMQIGKDKEIIILENSPPISCNKIRYYDDKTFMERLRDKISPPDIELKKREAPEVVTFETDRKVVERPLSVDDIKNIDNLSLDDFSCDFSDFVVPEGEISDDDMDDLVDKFFDGMRAA